MSFHHNGIHTKFVDIIDSAYNELIKWWENARIVPTGKNSKNVCTSDYLLDRPTKIRSNKNELKQEHTEPAEIQQNVRISGPIEFVPTKYFASIDESSIQKARKLTKGGAGPSQFDAAQFRKILCSRKKGQNST